jgi:predicted SAM-dependent methyltransferase
MEQASHPVRLNLGSGRAPIPGFVNVDILPDEPGVDVVADIGEPLPFDDGSVDLIYASHVLEHFPHGDVPRILGHWRRVLRDGGELLIGVPDLDAIAAELVRRRGWFTPPFDPWLGAIYGGQKDAYDFHKGGFTAPWLAYLLTQAGFGTIKRVKWFPDIGVPDTTLSQQPFGHGVSLNMRAVAGAPGLPSELFEQTRAERALGLVDRAWGLGMRTSSFAHSRLAGRRRRRMERVLR